MITTTIRSCVPARPHDRSPRLSTALRRWQASRWGHRGDALRAAVCRGRSGAGALVLRTLALSLALAALVGCVAWAEAGEGATAGQGPFRGKIVEMTAEDPPVKVWGADGQPVLTFTGSFDRKGLALLTSDYGMRLEGGCFFSGAVEDHLGPSLKNAGGELTFSAHIQPATASQDGTGCLLGYAPPKGELLFAVTQEKDALTFRASPSGAEPVKVELCRLKDAKPFHLTVTVAKGAVLCYRDGVKAAALPGIKGDFSGWANGILYFGNDRAGKLPWRGVVEQAALYNRALSADEVAKAAASVLEEVRKRAPVARVEFEGKLLSRPTYPMPWKEGFTYREVLAICEYQVDKVIAGDCKEPKIYVTEWMYVDKIFLAGSRREIGSKRRLSVELFSTHPQFNKVERALPVDLDPERGLDRDVYYDHGPLQALPEAEQPKPPAGAEIRE
ncbi:MAG TPA: LamG domain-containing protein [Planctomycetota bacterium]|nr:LamG domain-containing protein [Planctomycetota bacterium]